MAATTNEIDFHFRGEKGIGKSGNPLLLKGTVFCHILSDSCQGGDVTRQDGMGGGECIYGETLEDENFQLKHIGPGVVSVVNYGRPNTNCSVFTLSTVKREDWDNKYVMFGQVSEGMDVVMKMVVVETKTKENSKVHTPVEDVVIVDCGQL